MQSIRISQDVYQEIAKRGKFGETEDDVLRRVFQLPERSKGNPIPAKRRGFKRSANRTKDKLSAWIENGQLHVEFQSGNPESWKLPNKGDKVEIRHVRDSAAAFAEMYGATEGQVNAVKKALTNAGYYLIK